MENSKNDTITIELDKIRTIKFRRKELKMLEDMFKINYIYLNIPALSIDEICKVLEIGLRHEDDSLTSEKVEELADDYPYFGEITKKLTYAFFLSQGPEELGKYKNRIAQIEEKMKDEEINEEKMKDEEINTEKN